MAEKLIERISEKDEDDFRSMFTSDALATEDFDEGQKYTFDLFSGNDFSINILGVSTGKGFYGIAGTREVKSVSSEIVTEAGNYELYFKYYTEDYYNPILRMNFGKNVGKVDCLILVEAAVKPRFIGGWGMPARAFIRLRGTKAWSPKLQGSMKRCLLKTVLALIKRQIVSKLLPNTSTDVDLSERKQTEASRPTTSTTVTVQ